MLTDKPKATHKIKKKSQGGFYSEFSSYNPKGKTFAQIILMIDDLRANVAFQLTRIAKLKYVLLLEKEKSAEKVKKVRDILYRREARIANLIERQAVLKGDIRKHKINIKALERKIEYRNKKIKGLEKHIYKKPEQVVVEVERKPTAKESAAIRAASLPLDIKVSEISSTLYKTEMFFRKESMTLKQMALLTQTQVTNGFFLAEVQYDRPIVERLEELEFISSGYVGLKSKRKFYSITPKGKEMVNEYKNWISYSKSYI